MEFGEKLQALRKRKGMTQEELASVLFVSRTAVSKWESGRGYPNIDSLKTIATFFSTTVDELLSVNEVLIIAEQTNKQKEKRFIDLVYGLIDICLALLFILPFFASRVDGIIKETSLIELIGIQLYLKTTYYIIVCAIVIMGILTLALKKCQKAFWLKLKIPLSLILGVTAILLFIISSQPYAAIFTFVLFAIKILLIFKRLMTRKVS